MIEINDNLSIPEWELEFTASRSAGPGGQHVNKVNSRVTLHFDVTESPSLSDAQRQRILRRLATRITKEGMLKLHAQRHRSQVANRRDLVERFALLLREALARPKPRRKTRPSRTAKTRRRDDKRQRGALKRGRSKPHDSDD